MHRHLEIKKHLRALSLEIRQTLEGSEEQPGDLENRLNQLGVWRDRPLKPISELSQLSDIDREARKVVQAYLLYRQQAGVGQNDAFVEFVRESAFSWANRLFTLRCLEARGQIDEVVLQKDVYGGRSLMHHRFAQQNPAACTSQDDGLFEVLDEEFRRRAAELPALFNPHAPTVALRPSIAALRRCLTLLSSDPPTEGLTRSDDVFTAHDTLGWAYQFWNTEEKERLFERIKSKPGTKIEGASIIPATCIYTEPYMVKFLIQNSLGAHWIRTHPDSELQREWEYYFPGPDSIPAERKNVRDISFLDPACGSGHFLVEAFDVFYAMYVEDGELSRPSDICQSIFDNNLFGIDIDERAVQIAAVSLVMKAKDRAPDFTPRRLNLVATNIRLSTSKDQLRDFLEKHPEDRLLTVM